MKIALETAARDEIAAASSYLEQPRTGTGEALLAELKSAESLLLRHPKCGSPLRGGYRSLILNRFPYSVIYRIDIDTIRIFAIAHRKRRPGYWRKRTR